MRKLTALLLFVGGVTAGVLIFGQLVNEAVAANKSVTPTPGNSQWEYNCSTTMRSAEKGHHASMEILNHLGKQGWELVAIDSTNGHFCFKRRL